MGFFSAIALCPNSGQAWVRIDQFSPATFAEGTPISLSIPAESWHKLTEDLTTGKFSGKELIGWYHSHPGMGIFLSEPDMALHDSRFPEPWMPALVIDPRRNQGGFFCRRSGILDRNNPAEFFELLEGSSLESEPARRDGQTFNAAKTRVRSSNWNDRT